MPSLSDPVSTLNGVGAKLEQAFNAKGIDSVYDLLLYLPRKYIDYTDITDISKLKPGNVSIKAHFSNVTFRRARRGLSITEAIASDSTGSVRIIWFNQPYRKDSIRLSEQYYISGEFKLSNQRLNIINPYIEQAGEFNNGSGRILPTYSESKLLSSWMVRKAVKAALPLSKQVKDMLPEYLISSLKLEKLDTAIINIHTPSSIDELDKARQRFQFNELFPQLLANELANIERLKQKTIKVPFNASLAKEFVAKLPFKLTNDQRRVIWQIYQDMGQSVPMNRMVEGDVGSGKTVVAVMSALMAMAEGYKVAFMAPTELLANQHAETINKLLAPLGLNDSLVLLTGGMKSASKKAAIEKANKINGAFVVGTHSLLTSGVDWSNLALLIIDEQHRFGVDQRMSLQKQTNHLPHFLSITATPIPRSLALTYFNDLSISRLKEMPSGRRQIKSSLIAPGERSKLKDELVTQLSAGRQIYVVCPLIHPNDKSDDVAAEEIFIQYSKQFTEFKVGLIHGQLDLSAQAKVMKSFASGKINILVATTIIEVGVDVANASVMVIYGPERLGLAQLHQLRGRVGRGEYQSYCYVVLSDSLSPSPRLRQFTKLTDGFELSELDLSMRGPGAIYGKLQHGKGMFSGLMSLDDHKLITKVQAGIKLFIDKKDSLNKYPELKMQVQEAQQMTYLN